MRFTTHYLLYIHNISLSNILSGKNLGVDDRLGFFGVLGFFFPFSPKLSVKIFSVLNYKNLGGKGEKKPHFPTFSPTFPFSDPKLIF
tara:strand:- start:5191 stop:5451 length:261 start_codon:yes stop_codon:yes gene_type:complete